MCLKIIPDLDSWVRWCCYSSPCQRLGPTCKEPDWHVQKRKLAYLSRSIRVIGSIVVCVCHIGNSACTGHFLSYTYDSDVETNVPQSDVNIASERFHIWRTTVVIIYSLPHCQQLTVRASNESTILATYCWDAIYLWIRTHGTRSASINEALIATNVT